MSRFFIAGVPATRKTSVGDYLQKYLDFRHYNVESDEADPSVSRLGQLFWNEQVEDLINEIGSSRDIVITWGFVCDDERSIRIIKKLQKLGFKFIWFFAEEPLAKLAFIKRSEETGSGDINAFDLQMKRIEKFDVNTFNDPVVITTSSEEGWKTESQIVDEIMKLVGSK